MTWVPYLFIGFLGLGVWFQERRLQRLERGRQLDRIRVDNVVACSRHQQRAGEIMADSLGNVRKTLADHAVELHDLAHEVERYRYVGDDVRPVNNPWSNRGGLN